MLNQANKAVLDALVALHANMLAQDLGNQAERPTEEEFQACMAAASAAIRAATEEGAPAPADPMDWPLPCDVVIGHITMRKGLKLSALVKPMQVLYEMTEGASLAAQAELAAVAGPAGIYVASRASLPERPARWRALRTAGWPIVSTWIDEAGPGETDDVGELWERIAREVASAQGVVLHVEPDDFPLKGALIEVGMALSLGKRVGVYAPGVALEDRSMRPLGSWAAHPLVRITPTLQGARDWIEAAPQPQAPAQEPAAWRHNRTLCLYETKAEVPLGDSDEWAEPLYTHPSPPEGMVMVTREPLHATVVKRIWNECRDQGLDYVAFAWRIQRAALTAQKGGA